MSKNLLIVESPAKAKTIEKFLGVDFEVKSCFGHIRDLEKEGMGIDLKNGYEPRYKVPEDKTKVVSDLKKTAKIAKEVWLASDEDREGESISWHLAQILGLDLTRTKRIVFHEITKQAILKAVENPRLVDMNLVNAQQARRILDRLVGFELSPVLWRKIGMKQGLSAGRVQSVAVRLIVEREREINSFKPESSYKIEALFTAPDLNKKNVQFYAQLPLRPKDHTTANDYLTQCKTAIYTVKEVQTKPTKRSPAAPFTTSTLQQEASRKLGYSVLQTMRIAQKLYESGKITYMRTDSVNLSQTAIQEIEQEITSSYEKKYVSLRKYANKNESAQDAHEAIRPTAMNQHTLGDEDGNALYQLIWKRTVASQMSDARFEKTTAKIEISTTHDLLTASGEVLVFDGFLKLYREDKDDDEQEEENVLPPLQPHQKLPLKEMVAIQKFTRPAARYTEAALVKKLEELGIGRPSTYAPTITTIVKRNYIEKRDKEGIKRKAEKLTLSPQNVISSSTIEETVGTEKSKLFPTDLGMVVTDFLKQHFDKIMDYGFTATIENQFDEIAEGKTEWSKMIDDFYQPFHLSIENTLENADRSVGERELGNDPVSGKKIIARMGRYGPMVQIGSSTDEDKPKFAKLRPTQSIETILLEEALELFRLPRILGQYENEEVGVNIGRFGPYIAHNKKFYSLPKTFDPYTVCMEEALPIIIEKRAANEKAIIKEFEKEKIRILNGPYGPYIKQGLKNYKLRKEFQDKANSLTIEEVKNIIETEKANPTKKRFAKKKAKT